ncbi:hypothetical protein [uncultured Williamsia sp.]|uniref:hypothetical protein n=1 Tax=uncultured Williamsia sp. TaxID=259311 RepID=UPI0034582650
MAERHRHAEVDAGEAMYLTHLGTAGDVDCDRHEQREIHEDDRPQDPGRRLAPSQAVAHDQAGEQHQPEPDLAGHDRDENR